jgi:hypothetical protein
MLKANANCSGCTENLEIVGDSAVKLKLSPFTGLLQPFKTLDAP